MAEKHAAGRIEAPAKVALSQSAGLESGPALVTSGLALATKISTMAAENHNAPANSLNCNTRGYDLEMPPLHDAGGYYGPDMPVLPLPVHTRFGSQILRKAHVAKIEAAIDDTERNDPLRCARSLHRRPPGAGEHRS